MKAIDQLKATAEKIGVTLDVTDYDIHCDAPSGYVWRANDLPSLHIHYASNSETWLMVALRESKSDLLMGLEKVTDAERLAEHRWNLDDDAWGAAPDAPETISWPVQSK